MAKYPKGVKKAYTPKLKQRRVRKRENPDVYVLISGTAFLFIAMFIGSNKKLDRWQSGLLLATFISYTAYLISKEI